LNLATGDGRVLARVLATFYQKGRKDSFGPYSETVLRKVWPAERFSWWMTSLLHALLSSCSPRNISDAHLFQWTPAAPQLELRELMRIHTFWRSP
jgi:p-hydroxybenzoate 3-monooxygenase